MDTLERSRTAIDRRTALKNGLRLLSAGVAGAGATSGAAARESSRNPAAGSDVETDIDAIRTQIAELRKKTENREKDPWDKLAAVSGFASAVTVAAIGFYATNVYNKRQKISEERRRDQELLLSQIQTVEKFISHLASRDEQVKAAALVAIAAIGNEDLAVKLATAFKGPGATTALTAIASTAGLGGSEKASRALLDMFEYLAPRVVTLLTRDQHRAGGFIVDASGAVVTAAHAVKDVASGELTVALPGGARVPATLSKMDESKDLALLATRPDETLPPFDLRPSVPRHGDGVTALLFEMGSGLRLRIGTVVGLSADETHKVLVKLEVRPGDSGAPVVDGEGRLSGLVQMSDQSGTAYLIPASDIVAFLGA